MNPKREAILELMTQDPAYEDRFFRTKKNPVWFHELKKRGYFDPSNNPTIQPADREGYYVIPQWNVLEYLERVSEQVNIPGNEEYVGELLEIIKNVSTYKNAEGEIVDNYRTWWFFIKILLKLPNEKVSLEILDLVPVWLSSHYGSSLVDADSVTKLLPKFLYEGASENDIKKAEKLVVYLTDFVWIQRKGVFNEKEEEAHGVVEDHWLIDSFVEKGRANLIGKLCSKTAILNLAEKLKTILVHKTNSKINVDYEGVTYRLSVGIDKEFEYICKIGTYKKKTVTGEEDFRDDYSIDIKELFSFDVNAKNSETFTKTAKQEISKLNLPVQVIEKMNEGLSDFYRFIYHDYSYVWFKDLYSISESKFHDFRAVLVAILVESFLEKVSIDRAVGQEIINDLLAENFQHQIFKRLVIVAIAKNWDHYAETFWKLLPDMESPLLEEPAYEDEMRYLLRENISKFSLEEKKKIDELISKGPQKYIIEENKEKYIIYWKQRWYGALKDDSYFAEKYKLIRESSGYKDDEEKIVESEWVGPGSSALTEEEMLKLSNEELVKNITKFKQKDIISKGPTTEGLATALENAVKMQPDKFAQNLDPFIDVGFFYVYHMIQGFDKAWSSKISFDWNRLLIFLEKYIDRPAFWKNKLVVAAGFYNADNKWIIGSIGELIQEGTRDDKWSISEDHFHIIKNIFLLIANKAAKDKENSKNFPNHAINCGLGKINIGLVYLTLRIARLQKASGKEVVWDDELRKVFETFLARNIYDAYTVLGENLISFAYLDKEWTEMQIKKLSITKDKVQWEAFMSGYLAASRVNLDLYKLMKSNYVKGLAINFEESILNERLIDHIGIGYLNSMEEINGGGLLQALWNKWDPKQIMSLIFYFWTQRESLSEREGESELDKSMRTRIINFWREVYKKIKDKDEILKNDKEILSEITKLIIFLPRFDEENYKWIMLSAPYVQEHYNSAYLLECINKLKDKGDPIFTAQKIGSIFIEMMKTFKPDFDVEDIRSIVDFLYKVNDLEVKKLVNSICDEYAKNNIEIVTDIYNKYNS